MFVIHAIERFQGVDNTSVWLACDAGNLERRSDGGRDRSGNLIQCGPALTEEAI
jgi:hypothetical protein